MFGRLNVKMLHARPHFPLHHPTREIQLQLIAVCMNLFQHRLFLATFFSTPDLAAADGRVRVTGGQSGGWGGSEDVYCSAEHQWSGQHRDGKTIDKTMSYLKMGRRRYFWKWWGGPRRRGWTRGNKGVVSCSAVFRLSYLGMSSNPISRKSKIQILNAHCVRFNKKTHYKKHHIFIPLVTKLSLSELLWTHGSAIWLPIYSLQK